jgi:outer membrane protein OmpA-like peptidoglycan-associated protein
MDKTLQRILGIALVALPFIFCPAMTCHQDKVLALNEPVAIATPETSASPEAIATPEASPAPEASASPEASATPDAMVETTPDATATPEATEATPEASASPEATATPEAPVATPEATPEAPTAPVASGVQGELNKALEVKNIEFETSKARLTRRGRRTLDYVASELKKAPEAPVDITGHTDSRGDDTMNLKLSEARAQATLAYLVKKGISKERLTAAGLGEKQPKASNNTPAGRQRNRRIEFKLH